MTINLAIAKIDAIKINAYDDPTKASWISELDGKILLEVHKAESADDAKYVYPTDGDENLLVPFPYDNIYELYLGAMIDFNNKEFGNYNNSMTMFNTAFDEYKKYYKRTHTSTGQENFKYVY